MRTKLITLATLFLCASVSGQTFTDMTTILNSIGGGAPCVVDMNGDGLDDVVIVSGGDLFIEVQQPDGTFITRYHDTNFQNFPSWSICAGDLDGNGYTDLMFGGGQRVSFIMANSNGTAYTEQYINEYIFSQRTNLVDIDNDGFLDAFACHDVDQNHPYRNDGAGFMSEDQSLITTVPLRGNYASVWTDFDNDGDTDMYLSKCHQGSSTGAVTRENALYVNNGGGVFTESAAAYGLFDNQQSWATIFEDFDNDGDLDTYTVNHTGTNLLKQNDGTGHYTEITAGSGIDMNDLDSWACVGADFDNDGFVDILTESNVNKQLYHNNGNMSFTAMSMSFDDGALGDLNNDGFLDVFTGNKLWMNNGNANHWIKIGLEGTTSNINGIGARVEIYGAWGIQIRESRSGESFNPMSSLDVSFGIGTSTSIDSMIVRWPSGIVDVVYSPSIDTRVTVVESALPVPCMAPADLNVVEIGFGTSIPRVNATWVNPENTTSCEVKGGRISDATAGTANPVFQNAVNTKILSQTNGSTVNFNVALYNNPTIPFVIGKTYGYEVRCQCEDGSGFSDWSGMSLESTFVVPAAPPGVFVNQNFTAKALNAEQIKVFPNPNDGHSFNLDLSAASMLSGKVRLNVYDLSGRNVSAQEFFIKDDLSILSVDIMEELKAGLYLLELSASDMNYQTSFIIQ
mgnify:FL=1|jgi:hypothetical protein